jgi:hypothetical protein
MWMILRMRRVTVQPQLIERSQMSKQSPKTRVIALAGLLLLLTLGLFSFLAVRPVIRANRALRLLAATQVGRTSTEDFRKMAHSYGVELTESGDTFDLSQQNMVLRTLHFAPPTAIMMNATTTNGVISRVLAHAWVGENLEFAKINIDEFDSQNTSCGDVPICVQPTSSTMTTYVFFAPSTPLDQRVRLLSLNTWCLAQLGGCKSSREFFPIAWEYDNPSTGDGKMK